MLLGLIANMLNICLVLSPTNTMSLAPTASCTKYMKNGGKKDMLKIPTPPNFNYTIGLAMPREHSSPNETVISLCRWCPVLKKALTASAFSFTGSIVFHLLDVEEYPVDTELYWDQCLAVLRGWNREHAQIINMYESLQIMYAPVCELVRSPYPPMKVLRVISCHAFCHQCGDGGSKVVLSKCPSCSSAMFCSRCKTEGLIRHHCFGTKRCYIVEWYSLTWYADPAHIVCCACDAEAVTVCSNTCAFAFCSNDCKNKTLKHHQYCQDQHIGKTREMLMYQLRTTMEKTNRKKKKLMKNKSADALEDECLLCLTSSPPMIGLPCSNKHPDLVHRLCINQYLKFGMTCPICRSMLDMSLKL